MSLVERQTVSSPSLRQTELRASDVTVQVHPAFLPSCPGSVARQPAPAHRGLPSAFSIDSLLSSHVGLAARTFDPRLLRHYSPYVTSYDFNAALAARGHHASAADTPEQRHTDWRPSKSKRVRTIFTPEQLERLEQEFDRQQYMVGTERYYLAAALNLTEAQVKVWFQNRRIKWRKQHIEAQHAKLSTNQSYESESESDNDQDDSQHCAT